MICRTNNGCLFKMGAMYGHPKVIFSHQIRGVSMLRFFLPGSVNRAVGVQQGWPSAIIALLVGGVKTWG